MRFCTNGIYANNQFLNKQASNLSECECEPSCADSEGGAQGVRTPSEKSQNIGFLSNTGPDPLENYKAAKPAFNVRPPLARQCSMAFRWWAGDAPLLVIIGSSLPLSKIKEKKTWSEL